MLNRKSRKGFLRAHSSRPVPRRFLKDLGILDIRVDECFAPVRTAFGFRRRATFRCGFRSDLLATTQAADAEDFLDGMPRSERSELWSRCNACCRNWRDSRATSNAPPRGETRRSA
jgi:hypothetical protein